MPAAAPLRLAFLGSPRFAVPALDALHDAGHTVVCVYAQPPRPAGRGQRAQRAAVHERADALGLPVRTPARLRGEDAEGERAAFAALDLDVAVVAAYGLLLPEPMLRAPRRGCLNIHASLLPRWRGAAPVQAAIRAGDADTGISIMRMDRGLDTGAVLLRRAIPIGARDTAPVLLERLAALGATLIGEALAGDPAAEPQPDTGVTHAPRLTRADGVVDWTAPAAAIDRQIRALTPWPGTATALPDGGPLKLLDAAVETVGDDGSAPAVLAAPGTLLDDRGRVACGKDVLRLLLVQAPGRPSVAAADFLRGRRVAPGTRLGG